MYLFRRLLLSRSMVTVNRGGCTNHANVGVNNLKVEEIIKVRAVRMNDG